MREKSSNRRKHSNKEIIMKMLHDERNRQEEVNRLKTEMHNILAKDDIDIDTDRIDEIIAELDIIDPLGESEDEPEKLIVSKPKRKHFRFRYAIAVGVLISLMISYEAVSVTGFGNNFFASAPSLSKAIISIFRGNEMEEDDTARVASGVREYKTIDKLNKTEKLNIIVPNWLPDDIKVESIKYHDNYGETGEIYIKYDDGITNLTIKLDSTVPDDIDSAQIYESNKIKFYAFSHLNMVWWEYESDFYSFACGFAINEYADKVIENIK